MNTDRLQKFLGEKYQDVIRYTIADAFADCFKTAEPSWPSNRRQRLHNVNSPGLFLSPI